MSNFKRVLVIGGCGWLGHRVVDLLLIRGALVDVVDDLSTADLDEDGDAVHCNHLASYRSTLELAQLIGECDVLVHLGIRYPLERERALRDSAWASYVDWTVRAVSRAMACRAPLRRVVIGAMLPSAYRVERKVDPAIPLQAALRAALAYDHVPGSLAVHLAYLPELTGAGKPTPIREDAVLTAPVEAAAELLAVLALDKERADLEQFLPDGTLSGLP